MARQDKLGSANTSVHTDEHGKTHVTYHATDVVTFDDVTITLDSGEWRTVSTARRMNQASNQYGLGYQVFQVHGEWFVGYGGEEIVFVDGLELRRL